MTPWRFVTSLALLALAGPVPGCTTTSDTGPPASAGFATRNGALAQHAAGQDGCGKPTCKPGSATPKKVHAALPGESHACKALGIAACNLKFSGGAGQDTYFCFDAAGQPVAVVPLSEVPTSLPCSQAQLDAWVAAYATPCWRWGATSDLPASAITLLLDPKGLPHHVCSNVDRTIFHFTAACAEHTYTVTKDTGGGNFHGTYWNLTVAPPTTASLRPGFPFVDCMQYEATNATGCLWDVEVTRGAEQLLIAANDITHPCSGAVDWPAVLELLTTAFTSCGAQYAF